MSYHRSMGKRATGLAGFREDAVKAMTENPSYFASWYTAKSFALVAALVYIAFVHGRRSRR